MLEKCAHDQYLPTRVTIFDNGQDIEILTQRPHDVEGSQPAAITEDNYQMEASAQTR